MLSGFKQRIKKRLNKLRRYRAFVFAEMMLLQYRKNDVSRTGAQLAYYFLFALFPMFILLGAVAGSLKLDPAAAAEELYGLLPKEVLEFIYERVSFQARVFSRPFIITGAALSLMAMFRAVRAMTDAINLNFEGEGTRKIKGAWSLVFAAGLSAAVLIISVLIAAGSSIMAWMGELLGLADGFIEFWGPLRFLFLAVVIAVILQTLYQLAPRKKCSFLYALPGTVFSLVVLVAMSAGFSYYVDNISAHSFIYGSLGAVMLLLLWLYIAGNIIIIGGELNFVISSLRQNKTAHRPL